MDNLYIHPDAAYHVFENPVWAPGDHGAESRVRSASFVSYDEDHDEIESQEVPFSSHPHYPTMADLHEVARKINTRIVRD